MPGPPPATASTSAPFVSGFGFIRNGVVLGYPFLEAYRSVLPLVDELVVAVGRSEDDTEAQMANLAAQEPRLRLIPTVWDESLRTGGRILAQQTDVALRAIRGTWGLYIQGDEVLHEADYPAIRRALHAHAQDPEVEGLLFRYRHFYGSYAWVGTSRHWYRQEVRVVRNLPQVHSWRDAQGFRHQGRKLRVAPVDATVYHYGWARPPQAQQRKQASFHRWWHPDDWVARHVQPAQAYTYDRHASLAPFAGTHPAVMQPRVQAQDWAFDPDPTRARRPLKERLSAWVERHTGWRPGEYRNFVRLRRPLP